MRRSGETAPAARASISGTGQGMSLGNENTHTVYGLLPNTTTNQDAPVGNYTDVITVTVTY